MKRTFQNLALIAGLGGGALIGNEFGQERATTAKIVETQIQYSKLALTNKAISALRQDLALCETFEELNAKHDALEAEATKILITLPPEYQKDFGYVANLVTHPGTIGAYSAFGGMGGGITFMALFYLASATGMGKRQAAEAAGEAAEASPTSTPEEKTCLQQVRALIPSIDWSQTMGFPKALWNALKETKAVSAVTKRTSEAIQKWQAKRTLQNQWRPTKFIGVKKVTDDSIHATLTLQNGVIVQGIFDLNTGSLINGKMTSADGFIEEGTFDRDTKYLIEGKMTFPNGDIEEGTFNRDTRGLSEGEIRRTNGEIYTYKDGVLTPYTPAAPPHAAALSATADLEAPPATVEDEDGDDEPSTEE